MRPRITLILCIHNHQPVGERDWVLKEVFQKCYEPFVNLLESYPSVKLALHYSGSLLERMPKSFTDRIRKLVQNGQIELLSSGFYEPILPIVPFEDGVDQLSAYTNFLREKFGRRPDGFWLAEKVWEPNIPQLAVQSDLKYTLTDDTHFLYAGLRQEALNGYYITEYQGSSICVFPIARRLHDLIPYGEPEETIDYLGSFADGSILVYGDDGEKFGCWPGSYEFVWRKEWLKRFFDALEKTEWIAVEHPSTVLARTHPKGRVYLPTASHDEMDEWSLPARRQSEYTASKELLKKEEKCENLRAFLRGGYFRNFFAKYPEANRIHKKMIYVSRKVRRMREKGKARAKRELWQGQENCAYWHGGSGGLYLPHLREALYSHLISAEVIADKEARGRNFLRFTEYDFDCDGREESLIETPLLNLYVHTLGGRIFELDYRPSALNFVNTLARREEVYHSLSNRRTEAHKEFLSVHDLVGRAPKDFKRNLVYDRTTRDSLIDHLLTPGTTQQRFAEMGHSEVVDLSNSLYRAESEQSESEIRLELSCEWEHSSVAKIVSVNSKEAAVSVNYRLHSADPQGSLFGVEFNLSLSQPTPPKGPSTEMLVLDEEKRIAISFRFDTPAEIWIHPVETLSRSGSEYNAAYQGFCLMPVWRINTRKFDAGIRLEISTC